MNSGRLTPGSTDSVHTIVEHALTGASLDPGAASEMASRFVIDTIAVGIAGSVSPFAAPLRAMLERWGHADDCDLLGLHGGRWPAPSAAFMNAYQIHGSEYDCVHEPAVVHPMAAVLAASLAAWQQRRESEPDWILSGRQWLDLLSRSVDVAIAVGMSARQGLRFFRPATAGAFGAVAAVCQIRNYSQAQTVCAFGHLYSQLCGTMQAHTEGAAVLPMQIGFNARNALIAADLAHAGISAPENIFDGAFGYFELYEVGGDLGASLEALTSTRRILELSYKPFPTGRATHGGLDGLLRLRQQHGIVADQVSAARVIGPPLIKRLVGRPLRDHDFPAHYARLCMAYVGAVALRRGHVDLNDFAPSALRDPQTLALAARVQVIDDGNSDPNALLPQRVEIDLQDGTMLSTELPSVIGSPQSPLSEQAYWTKTRHCLDVAGFDLQTINRFVDDGRRLPELNDLSDWLDPVLAGR